MTKVFLCIPFLIFPLASTLAAELVRAPLNLKTCKNCTVTVKKADADAKLLNRLMTLEIIVEGSAHGTAAHFELQSFDARMPEHNHGMLVTPKLEKKTANEFLAKGVKFHMAGNWMIYVRGDVNGEKIDLSIPLRI